MNSQSKISSFLIFLLLNLLCSSFAFAEDSTSSKEEAESESEDTKIPGVIGTSIEVAGEQLERSRDGILPENTSGPLAPFLERFNSPTRCLAGKTICERIEANQAKENKEKEEKE